MVVAQLVERLLPMPEVRSSNPFIGKKLYLYGTFVYCQLCVEKTKVKKKRPGMAHFKKRCGEAMEELCGQHVFIAISKLRVLGNLSGNVLILYRKSLF